MTGNPFRRFWDLGYRRLVPIVPPGAPLSERSSLARRAGTTQDARGKVPGVRHADGTWSGMDWVPHETIEADLDRWAAMGAGVGVKTGEGLVAVDADTLDENSAVLIRDQMQAHFGTTPIRVGRLPKALYLLRCEGPAPYMRVEFGPLGEQGKSTERCEILTDRRQFVARGIHPVTGTPYVWPREPVPYDALPCTTPEALRAFLSDLRGCLPNAAVDIAVEGAGAAVDQAVLTGSPEHIRRAVAAIPNTDAAFSTRESYLSIGYAIKAALPGDPEAFDIFSDWCARWTGGHNDPGVIEADWRRMKPPFRRGADYIYQTAERLSGGAFSAASVHFTPEPDRPPSPFEMQAQMAAAAEATALAPISATPFAFPDPTRIEPRRWLYGRHYIRKFVSATVAPSGVGKSSLAIVEALAMVSGKPLLGEHVYPGRYDGRHRVWLWNGEDPMDELERRVSAAMIHYGLTRDDIGDRLFLDTGREQEIVIASDTRDGCTISAPVVGALAATIAEHGIDLVTIDPFVASHRVSENDNGSIDRVTKQWARIADQCNCAVELVHHVRKLNGNETTVEDTRGASALLGTSRSARALARMTKAEAARLGLEGMLGRLFRFSDAKNNLALSVVGAGTDWMQLHSISLGNGGGVEAFRSGAGSAGDTVGVVGRFEVPEAGAAGCDRVAVLEALADGPCDGRWRADARSPDWAGHAIGPVLGVDTGDAEGKARVREVLKALHEEKAIRTIWGEDSKRNRRQLIEVRKAALDAARGAGAEEPESDEALSVLG